MHAIIITSLNKVISLIFNYFLAQKQLHFVDIFDFRIFNFN